MFENLTARLGETFRRLRGRGKLSEADVREALREVRLALLEADVNYKVAKDFVESVRERAVGQEVLRSITPGQQVVKIVHDELTRLMGGEGRRLQFDGKPGIAMLVGLQGSGKTTTAGKLAGLLRREGRRPLLVAADVYRPAAVTQLQVVGGKLEIPVFSGTRGEDPVSICRQAVSHAVFHGRDVLVIDTAGRLHIDEEMMREVEGLKTALKPHHLLLVVDAMTGQDAVNVAEAFHRRLGLSGVILTKLDGDARGGAALSVKAVTGAPILFAGVGEKLEALEPFHPDRMASRILGMGDVVTLVEKAQKVWDKEQAGVLERKLRTQEFTLQDFLDQLKQVRRMGSLDQLLSMIPGFSQLKHRSGVDVDERELVRIEAVINSMTGEERRNPGIIDGSRKKRIARGSGTTVQDVNRLLKQFEQTKKMFKQLGRLEKEMKRGRLPWG